MFVRVVRGMLAAALLFVPGLHGSEAAAGEPEQIECPDGPVFTVLPLALDDFRALRPLGFLSPPIHVFPAKHSAFSINVPGQPTRSGAEVRFPADAVVNDIFAIDFPNGTSGFQVRFTPCSEIFVYFNHLGTVSTRLLNAFERGNPRCDEVPGLAGSRRCQLRLSVRVEAGELAGTHDGTAGVDFGFVDYGSKELAFADRSHYADDYLHAGSPVPYFAPELRRQLTTRLGSYDGSVRRTAKPVYGSLMQDVKGTAQGNWFTPGGSLKQQPDPGPFLALVHDYVDPAQPIFSVGTSLPGVRPGLYAFETRATGLVNRDFDDVRSDGSIYCYEGFLSGMSLGRSPFGDPGGVLLVSMPTRKTLRIERIGQPGTTCAGTAPWRFGVNAAIYER